MACNQEKEERGRGMEAHMCGGRLSRELYGKDQEAATEAVGIQGAEHHAAQAGNPKKSLVNVQRKTYVNIMRDPKETR